MTMNKHMVELLRKTLAPLGEEVRRLADEDIEVAGRRFVLVSAGRGLPRDVERITDRLTGDAIALADRFTPAARAKLDAGGMSWVDQTAARIRTRDGRLSILIDGSEPEPRAEAAAGFSPAALHVGERLLITRRVEPVAAIAEAARVSQGRVSQVLRWFDQQGYTAKHGGRGPSASRSLDTAALLDAWTDAIQDEQRPTMLAHTASRDPRSEIGNLTRGLRARHLDFRLSGWAGLDRAAPFLTATPVIHIYLDAVAFARLPDELDTLHLAPVEEAGVVTFWRAPDVTFTADGRNHDAAHPARLMGDLLRLGGRGVDAAEHVRAEFFDAAR
jgi:hypothetical protein